MDVESQQWQQEDKLGDCYSNQAGDSGWGFGASDGDRNELLLYV